MSDSKFTVIGGSTDSFASVLSSFQSTNTNGNATLEYEKWLLSLNDSPTPIKGTYIPIHELLQKLGVYYNGGNLVNNNNINSMNVNLTANMVYNIGISLENAYNYYSNILNNDETICQYNSNDYTCDDDGIYFSNSSCTCQCKTDLDGTNKIMSFTGITQYVIAVCLFFINMR